MVKHLTKEQHIKGHLAKGIIYISKGSILIELELAKNIYSACLLLSHANVLLAGSAGQTAAYSNFQLLLGDILLSHKWLGEIYVIIVSIIYTLVSYIFLVSMFKI